jgi:hypothetical protein
MDLEDQPGLVRKGAAEVGQTRPVRGPDLDEADAGRRHDVGDPELPPDLDELAAGHEHVLAPGQGREREQDGGGAVVDHERVLGSRDRGEQHLGASAPPASGAGLGLDLQVRVAGGDPRRGRGGGLGQRRAAEARVQDHAGGVDHTAEPVRGRRRATERRREDLVVRRGCHAPGRRGADLLEGLHEGPLHERSPEGGAGAPPRIGAEERVDGRDPAAGLRAGALHDGSA